MPPITTGVERKCASTAKLAALQVSKLASEKAVTVIVPVDSSIDPEVCSYILYRNNVGFLDYKDYRAILCKI